LGRRLSRRGGQVVDWILPPENTSAAVYGVIVIGALLAGESGSHETYADTVASAVIATCLYWFAHAYTNLLGARLDTGERLTIRTLSGALAHDWALVRGATIPLIALLCGWAAGASQQTAVTVSLWSTVASLFLFELVAGIRSRAQPREVALQAGAGLAMGLAIVGLKIVLRH